MIAVIGRASTHAQHALAVAATIAVAALAWGCGGGDEPSRGGDANPSTDELAVSAPADGSFAFDQGSLETDAGAVTVRFDNPAPIAHDFCVEDGAGDEIGCTDLVAENETSETLDLEPGEYTFYCSVAGHREGGMEGELTVR